MEIMIENLGAISQGSLKVEKNAINIKYGINGSGKSTISKGIQLHTEKDDLGKLRTHGSDTIPNISMTEDVSNVIVFNQDYVDKYLFKDDLANNSFEIMINTNEYKLGKKKIDNMFLDLVTNINNANTKIITEELTALITNIPVEKRKNKNEVEYFLSGSSKFVNARKVSNLSQVLDDNSKVYKEKLEGNKNHQWLKWFQAGQAFIDKNTCPFCLNELPPEFENTVTSVANSVTTTNLKQNIEIKQVISNTEKYMNIDDANDLTLIVNNCDSLSQVDKKRMYEIVSVCQRELNKLNNLRSINIHKIKKKYENNTLVDYLSENRLDLGFFDKLSNEVKIDIEKINTSINNIIVKSQELESITKDFSQNLNNLVEDKKEYINDFLDISGIPYSIDILASNEFDYKTVLNPLESNEPITEECLSFGEKNAISLILFSLEASIDYELIILDDPVSSFDNNKKFAILYYLFTKENAAFTNKTVLLFTHDFDIIIDFIYKNEFKRINNKCSFVKNYNGVFSDIEIKQSDVSHTIRMWRKKAKNNTLHPLLRVVNLRKYLQYTCPEEKIAIDILSSIEHNDDKPKQKVNRKKQEINDKEKLKDGFACIKNWICDFDYDLYLSKVQDKMELKKLYENSDSSICKLQILRMIINLTKKQIDDKVFWDYLTEYYHVENNEMISLNEKNFDNIPNYIMRISDEIIEDIYKDNF